MVPRNFAAEVPDSLNPHFLHGVEVSSFLVPQLGQNTSIPPQRSYPASLPLTKRLSKRGKPLGIQRLFRVCVARGLARPERVTTS